MATVLLLHAVRGLQDYERAAAERLRAAGHAVVLPDLFDGAGAATIEEGMALKERVGWETAVARAETAAAALPPDAVLGGFSWGAAVAAELWARRPEAAGILLLHGLAEIPESARRGIPVQLHLAEPDPFEEEAFVGEVEAAARRAGCALETFRYPGAGHLFTDPALPGHDPAAAAALWGRVDAFLADRDNERNLP
jgi:dienelactone hydrolase